VTTLVDTGPIVAFLNRRDRHHRWAVEAMAAVRAPLLTCEAVLSKAVYLVRGLPDGPEKVIELLARGALEAPFRLDGEAQAVRRLLARYGDRPMDLADACLVRMSELHADCRVLTLDSEFRDVYRRHGRQTIPTLMPRQAR
jgi:predicted nucleic acid-binding protein